MNRNEARIFSREAADTLKELAAKHGLALSKTGGNYSGTGCRMIFDFQETAIVSEQDNIMLAGRKLSEWKDLRRDYVMELLNHYPQHAGKKFTRDGKGYTVVGMTTQGNVIGCDEGKRKRDGRMAYYRFPMDVLGKEAVEEAEVEAEARAERAWEARNS